MPVYGILLKYERKRAIRKISKGIEKNIIRELGKERNLIKDKSIPISFYNYSYIKDRIYQAYRQKVSLPTIITEQRGKRLIKMNKHILVIDDDIGIRESLSLVLGDAGYQVDTVESGEQGIEKVKNNKYNLIFLDIKMAGMNGIETLREIRKMGKNTCLYNNGFSERVFSPVGRCQTGWNGF